MRPPTTIPKVALAIPIGNAPSTPYLASKIGPHAPAVPKPPIKAIEPAITPINGSRPTIEATAIPTPFWINTNTEIASKKITSGRPPSLSLAKFALKPIEAKNISINTSCIGLLTVMVMLKN